jgi:hypothetical protein
MVGGGTRFRSKGLLWCLGENPTFGILATLGWCKSESNGDGAIVARQVACRAAKIGLSLVIASREPVYAQDPREPIKGASVFRHPANNSGV